jgi:hypothetical protein
MMKKTEALKDLYEALGGNRAEVAGINSEIGIYNAILALGEVDAKKFIPDAITAIAANFASIDPSPSLALDTANVTPTTSTQTLTPDSGHAYKKVEVSAVTAAIDANIAAGNIKSGVTILGVTGTYTGE